jgi:hypothetical protein
MSLIEKIKSMFKGNTNNDSLGNADLSSAGSSNDNDTSSVDADAGTDSADSGSDSDFDGGDFGD